MSFTELLQIIALIVFVVAAIGWSYKKTDLIAVGLALWVLSELVDGRLSSLNLGTILLILAFIAFVLAAIGWGYKKVGLIAVGLALWAASVVIPRCSSSRDGLFSQLFTSTSKRLKPRSSTTSPTCRAMESGAAPTTT